MSTRVRDLTQGDPLKLLVSFSLPLIIGNIFQQMYTMTDAAIVGQFAGQQALAAFGAADWFSWLVFGVASGFSHGFSILIAQRFGEGNVDSFRQSVALTIGLGLIIGAVLTTISLVCIRPMLHLMQTPAEIFELSYQYLVVIFIGTLITMSYNILASILRAMGDSRTPLWAMVIASITNIGLDLLFVIVFHWGLAGAAVATVIAQGVAATYCLISCRRVPMLKLERRNWDFDKKTVSKLFRLGTPMCFQNLIIAVGGMGVQTVINGFGTVFITGFVATTKLYGLLEVAATSYGYAVASFTGQNLGAKKYDRIRRGINVSLVVSMGMALVISAAMFLFGENLLSLFISAKEANAAEVMAVAKKLLMYMASMLFSLYLLYVYRSALQGLGDTVMPMLSGVAELVMRLGVALILPRLIGSDGIYYAEIAAWIGADLILIPAYYLRMRKLNRAHPTVEAA